MIEGGRRIIEGTRDIGGMPRRQGRGISVSLSEPKGKWGYLVEHKWMSRMGWVGGATLTTL